MNVAILRSIQRLRLAARAADRWRFTPLFVMCLAAFSVLFNPLSQAPQQTLSEQVRLLNPDARLYWGLAQNLVNGEGLYDTVRNEDISMCGYGPAVAMLTACKALGATRAELVKYANSGDVSGDYDQVVGYAGVVVC